MLSNVSNHRLYQAIDSLMNKRHLEYKSKSVFTEHCPVHTRANWLIVTNGLK